MLFLRHGREAELEADRLGVEYGSGAGYDPAGVPRFLATLARVDALSERGVPNWLSTHPDPGSRVAKAEPVAGKFVSADAKTLNRDQYLERIHGLVFGDNPKDGIVRGNEFLHPLLRFAREVSRRVGADQHAVRRCSRKSRAREHFMVLQEVEQPPPSPGLRRPGGQSLGDAAVAAMRKAGYTVVDGRIDKINGQDAHVGLYRGNAKDVGKVLMRAAHIALGRQLYVVAGFAPEKEFDQVDKRHPAVGADVPPAERGRSVAHPAEPYRLLRGEGRATRGNRSRRGKARASSVRRRWRS